MINKSHNMAVGHGLLIVKA